MSKSSESCESKTSFSNFIDGSKFKYTSDGNIALKYDKTTWSNVLLNDMLLEDYINSQYVIPMIEITPIYDININKKIKKFNHIDNINNYNYNYDNYNDNDNDNDDDNDDDNKYEMIDNFYINKNSNTNKINFNIKNKLRLSRKKNINKTKKDLKYKKIFDNYNYYYNEIDYIVWVKSHCDRCGENEKINDDKLCIFCEYYVEYMKDIYECCPGCKIYNGTGDICTFCRLYG